MSMPTNTKEDWQNMVKYLHMLSSFQDLKHLYMRPSDWITFLMDKKIYDFKLPRTLHLYLMKCIDKSLYCTRYFSSFAVDEVRPADELPSDDIVELDSISILGNGGGDTKVVKSSFALQSS
jgi:hypothetical protein